MHTELLMAVVVGAVVVVVVVVVMVPATDLMCKHEFCYEERVVDKVD